MVADVTATVREVSLAYPSVHRGEGGVFCGGGCVVTVVPHLGRGQVPAERAEPLATRGRQRERERERVREGDREFDGAQEMEGERWTDGRTDPRRPRKSNINHFLHLDFCLGTVLCNVGLYIVYIETQTHQNGHGNVESTMNHFRACVMWG